RIRRGVHQRQGVSAEPQRRHSAGGAHHPRRRGDACPHPRRPAESDRMTTDFWAALYVFVLASFIGLGVIRRVSRLLHTPLMSLTNAISAIAVGVAWFQPGIVHHGLIVVAIAAGFAVGIPLSQVPLTAVPQRTALSHAFGGLAAGLVGTVEYYLWLLETPERLSPFRVGALIAEIILGYLTFTGSLMAAGKLQEVKWIPQRPVTYPLQNVINFLLLVIALILAAAIVSQPAAARGALLFPIIIVLALAFGILLIIPIGGADMPTVIA